MYFFNDCSLELKSIFSTFGIWLLMLYIGNYNNSPWVFNNIWGFRSADNSYRSIIGQSSLIPLLKYYPEDSELISIADDKYRDNFIITHLDERF
ncbi:hypothetical protein [Fluviispira sanaruensis]|uniref:hypothetical protein n=1 Tax=Fluviispira sanaruensis TaxID=2493639 RepID=UPI00102E7E6D|nr:hypothetical protein [Fluviispira sanaruensis]